MRIIRVFGGMVFAFCCLGLTADTLQLTEFGTEIISGYSADNRPLDGLGNGASLANSAQFGFWGELSNGNGSDRRGHLTFSLPNISGQVLESATLRLYLNFITDNGDLSDMAIYHSQEDNAFSFVANDYHNATFVDTGIVAFTPASLTGQYYEFDVTPFVQLDYANDDGVAAAAFRFQLTQVDLDLTQNSNHYRVELANGVAVNPAQLVLNTSAVVPEKSTIWYLSAFAVLLFFRKQKVG